MSNRTHPASRVQLAAFTLIEVLAAMAVLTVLVTLLFMAFNNSSRIMIRGSNEMEKNQVVRAVLQQISRDIERTVYNPSPTVNMYLLAAPTETISGLGITNSSLVFLADLSRDEGNTNGQVVNVGYQITTENVTNLTASGATQVTKWVLQRGDDGGVTPSGSWWSSLPATYWKTMSDNVIGLAFKFYTNGDLFTTTWPDPAGTNLLPASVEVTIWAIDTENYNRALAVPSVRDSMITNNIHKYNNRVFLPRSTQN